MKAGKFHRELAAQKANRKAVLFCSSALALIAAFLHTSVTCRNTSFRAILFLPFENGV
jgi:hypothetical protein